MDIFAMFLFISFAQGLISTRRRRVRKYVLEDTVNLLYFNEC